MMRNDYRRALILLRGNAPGYSGHVRLERRTLMGSMYFLTQAPADCPVLRAALVGRGRDSYYACALGEMRRDGRGQAALSYAFDPRNVCGRELEQYQLIAITCAEGEGCRILLYGYVCGHAEMNWEGVRRALCGLYAGNIAREAEEAPPVGDLRAPEAERDAEEAREENREEISGEARVETQEETQEETREEILEEAAEEIRGEEAPEEPAEAQEREGARTAGERLGLDARLPWPEGAETLRELFQTLPAMEDPPDADYVYIEAPMPADSGYAYCAAGIRAEGGVPASVRYALPAAWTPEPPAGLEDYRWVGDQNRGWWVAEVAVY